MGTSPMTSSAVFYIEHRIYFFILNSLWQQEITKSINTCSNWNPSCALYPNDP